MKIVMTLAHNTVVAAGQRPRAQQEAVLAFYLVVLGLYHGKKFPAPLKLATALFKQAGSPAYARQTLTALQAKTQVPPISIPLTDFDDKPPRMALAKALMQATKPDSPAYLTVARLAHLSKNAEIAKQWAPAAQPPTKAGLSKEQYDKALTQFLKDKCIAMVREGATLPKILAELNSHVSGVQFKLPKTPGLGVYDDGQLHLNGDVLMTMKHSPVTLWAIRGANITVPKRAVNENTYVFAWQPKTAKMPSKAYKNSSIKKSAQDGWHAVAQLTKKLPKVKAAWMAMLKKGHALGALFHFAYLTSCRIGSEAGMSGGEVTFGGSTLKCSHLKIKGSTILVSYIGKGQGGKGQVLQSHRLEMNKETKELIEFLKKRLEGSKPQDLLFTATGKPFTNSQINAWLQAHVPEATIHKFRKLRGTQAAESILSELVVPAGIDQAAAEELFKTSMEKVGDVLGHYSLKGNAANPTSATALKHYISPELSASWFTDLGLEVPSFIPTIDN